MATDIKKSKVMTTETKNVKVLETKNINVAINGVNLDTNSQFKRENTCFITISDKPGTDFRNPVTSMGIKIDTRSIHYPIVKRIAEDNSKLPAMEQKTVGLTINIVKTDNGTTGWTIADVRETATKLDFIQYQMSKGLSKEEALELYLLEME